MLTLGINATYSLIFPHAFVYKLLHDFTEFVSVIRMKLILFPGEF